MLNKKALAASVSAPPAVYPEDVFSTYLYAGTGTAQTITNSIDLAGEGGLVWIKTRNGTQAHTLWDTARGVGNFISSNNTDANTDLPTATGTNNYDLNAFNADGFGLGIGAFGANVTGGNMCSWTFRKAPKFFDVVTYTGNGVAFRTGIPHNLGSTPGMIIVKKVDNTSDWKVWHRSLGFSNSILLNSTAAANSDTASSGDARYQGYIYSANSTTFATDAGSSDNITQINENGATYVAYLFAHDAGGFGESGTDNVISCGSYTTDGSGNATVNLGYEPQYILNKNISVANVWQIGDAIRGLIPDGAGLRANTSDVEFSGISTHATSTGFNVAADPSNTYIYMAIRRPMKVPTTGTEVFSPTVYTGTNADNRLVNTGIVTDMVWARQRNSTSTANPGLVVGDRLRGNPYLRTGTTLGLDTSPAENTDADSLMTPTSGYGNSFSAMNGFGVGNDTTSLVNSNTTSSNHIALAFKRASKFFDVVCYTGTGSNTTITHNLTVAPELIFVKRRNAASKWAVYANNDPTDFLHLNRNDATADDNTYWNDTSPTASNFAIGTNSNVNSSGATYVAYLFATLAGVSKVGTYTGNGSNQTINCGFSGGARFILIKQIDAAEDWFVWDTARGIVSGNDPYLRPNLREETTDNDSVDPTSSGFIVNQLSPTNINISAATYIYLAIA